MNSQTATRGNGPRDAGLLVLCVLLALVAWSGSLVRGGFAYDDSEAIEGNPVVEGQAPWSAAFGRDYWDHLGPAGHYRPLATLSLRVDHRVHGLGRTRGWHLSNVLMHAAVVLFAGWTWILVGRGRSGTWPWLGLALFALHPALADAVAWVSGRSSMLSALAGVSATAIVAALGLRSGPAGAARLAGVALVSALGVLGSMCGKEDGLVFALVLPVVALSASRRSAWAATAGAAVALVAYGFLRAGALGSPWPEAPGAPLAHTPLTERLLVSGRAQLEGLRLFFWPWNHPPTYAGAAFLSPHSAGASLGARVLAGVGWLPWTLALVAGLGALRRKPGSPVAISAVLTALAIAPVLQFVPSGVVFAPRFLYLPLLLLAPLTHRVAEPLSRGPWRLVLAILALVACAAAWGRSEVYSSRRAFHRAVLVHRPDDAPAWNELGLAEEESGDLEAARLAFQRAGALDTSYGRPWSNLGRLELAEGDLEQARVWFQRAVERGAANPVAHVNLGAAQARARAWPEAERAYRRALELAPGMVVAWRGLARSLEAQGRMDEARSALERALELAPGDELAGRRLRALDAAPEGR